MTTTTTLTTYKLWQSVLRALQLWREDPGTELDEIVVDRVVIRDNIMYIKPSHECTFTACPFLIRAKEYYICPETHHKFELEFSYASAFFPGGTHSKAPSTELEQFTSTDKKRKRNKRTKFEHSKTGEAMQEIMKQASDILNKITDRRLDPALVKTIARAALELYVKLNLEHHFLLHVLAFSKICSRQCSDNRFPYWADLQRCSKELSSWNSLFPDVNFTQRKVTNTENEIRASMYRLQQTFVPDPNFRLIPLHLPMFKK